MLNNLLRLTDTHSMGQRLKAVPPQSPCLSVRYAASQAGQQVAPLQQGPSAEFHGTLNTVLKNQYCFYFYFIFEGSVLKRLSNLGSYCWHTEVRGLDLDPVYILLAKQKQSLLKVICSVKEQESDILNSDNFYIYLERQSVSDL